MIIIIMKFNPLILMTSIESNGSIQPIMSMMNLEIGQEKLNTEMMNHMLSMREIVSISEQNKLETKTID